MGAEQTSDATKRTTAQIGRCGEILVQYRLLKYGVESAPMTTDSGIDLVAYAPEMKRAITIQVKANLQPKPAGGRGMLALDWWIPEASPAELIALVNLDLDCVWLFSHEELTSLAQQRSGGTLHFYFYTDPSARPKSIGRLAAEFDTYKLEHRVHRIFCLNGGQPESLPLVRRSNAGSSTARGPDRNTARHRRRDG
jgi:hypothetical protein